MMSDNVLLDPAIRDWVLIPIILISLCITLLRTFAQGLLSSPPTRKLNATYRNAQTAAYARQLLAAGSNISQEGFRKRVERYCGPLSSSGNTNTVANNNNNNSGDGDKDGPGLLQRKVENVQMEQMMDPSTMGEMMKGNFIFMVPNMLMMTLVSFFFSGFVIAKVPLHLSPRFKPMTQGGVDLDTLDVAYITSLSMYFMIVFGINGIVSLITSSSSTDAMMGSMNPMMQQRQGQPVDYAAVFKQLREELAYTSDCYKWALRDAPQLVIGLIAAPPATDK